MTEDQKKLTKMAKAKWQDKYINGPEGTFFVSCVYYRGEGWLEAILFSTDGGMPVIMKTLEMKANYIIVPRPGA